MHVELHFKEAVPVLEGEHRPPEHPEIGLQKAFREILLDRDVVELLLPLEEQAGELPLLRSAQAERREILDLALAAHQPGPGVARVVVVDEPVLVEDAVARRQFEGGYILVKVPEILVGEAHLAAAAHDVAGLWVARAVERAAGDVDLVEDGDVLPRHSAVADQIEGGRKARDAAADDGGLALFDPRRRERLVPVVGARQVRRRQPAGRPVPPIKSVGVRLDAERLGRNGGERGFGRVFLGHDGCVPVSGRRSPSQITAGARFGIDGNQCAPARRRKGRNKCGRGSPPPAFL